MMNVRYIMRGVLWLVGSLLLTTACSEKQEMPGEEVDVTSRMLNLSLSVASSSAEGNTLNGGYEEGVGWENVIDIAGGNYRIYFFSAGEESTYIGTFQPTLFTRVPVREEGQPTGTYVYHFMGKIPDGVGTTFKLVVLGNWRGYPSAEELVAEEDRGITIERLCGADWAKYTHLSPDEKGNWLNDKSLIPFYGVREYNVAKYAPDLIEGETIKEGAIVNLESDPVPMLRAVARVEVILDNSFMSFSEVKMDKINSIGFCAPRNALNYKDYVSTDGEGNLIWDWNQDFIRELHLVGKDNTNDSNPDPNGLKFTKVSSRSDDGETLEKWIAYVPEYRNIEVGQGFCSIILTLANPDQDPDVTTTDNWAFPTNTLYFAKYVDGKANNDNRLNIERNNIYRFTITGSTANLQCHLDIQPYAECKLEMDYGLMRDEDGDLKVFPNSDNSLPDFFQKYLNDNKKSLPLDTITNQELSPLRHENELEKKNDDYYAIHLKSDGLLSNAEIWLKDADGCQVLTNFAHDQRCDNKCDTRWVVYGEKKERREKDRDRDIRLQHNSDHSSVVLDPEGYIVYKNKENTTRYLVESWDKGTGNFWVVQGEENAPKVYVEMDSSGAETGMKKTEADLKNQ